MTGYGLIWNDTGLNRSHETLLARLSTRISQEVQNCYPRFLYAAFQLQVMRAEQSYLSGTNAAFH